MRQDKTILFISVMFAERFKNDCPYNSTLKDNYDCNISTCVNRRSSLKTMQINRSYLDK